MSEKLFKQESVYNPVIDMFNRLEYIFVDSLKFEIYNSEYNTMIERAENPYCSLWYSVNRNLFYYNLVESNVNKSITTKIGYNSNINELTITQTTDTLYKEKLAIKSKFEKEIIQIYNIENILEGLEKAKEVLYIQTGCNF